MKALFSSPRRFFIITLLSVFSLSSLAQRNNYPGFYISMQGDTIQGSFPKYRQWLNNPDRVRFLSSQNNAEIILTPMICQQFHVNGYETYVAYHGKRMTNPVTFDQSATNDSIDRYDTITSFLREFGKSESARFYIFKDNKRFNLYFTSNEGVMKELIQRVYVADNHSMQSSIYKEQLESLFPDRAEEISTLQYTETSLEAFLLKQKPGIKSETKSRQHNAGFYISGGVSINSLKFTPDASMDFSEKSYTSDPVPLLAIGYLFPFRRNFSRVFFLPQIRISSLKHASQVSANDASQVQSTTFRSSPVISLGFHFGYNIINRPDLQVSLASGAGLNFLNQFEQVDKSKFTPTNSSTVVTEMEALKPLIDLQATVIIKKRYVIWSAYNFPTHITIYPTTKDKFSSVQFGVGYQFR